MCTIIHHISSYIKGLLFLAVMVLNLGTHQLRAQLNPEDFLTPDNPYKVSTAKDLVDVFDALNDCYDFDPQWDVFSISLEADIDMSGIDFTPVQKEDVAVPVKFEGNGYTIKNLTFTGIEGSYSGLFPQLGDGTVIRNINFDGINVSLPSKNCGILAGLASGLVEVSDCSITNGVVAYTIPNKAVNIGGLIGVANYKSKLVCKNITVDLDYRVDIDVKSFGGVVGYLNSPSYLNFSNVVNRSKKTLTIGSVEDGVGGIFGFIQADLEKINVNDCSNYMNIEAGSPMVGGIVGQLSKPKGNNIINELYNCTNAGDIYSEYGDVGGIAGFSSYVKIYNCVNIGDISSYDPSFGAEESNGIGGIGGIVGTYNVKRINVMNFTLSSCVNLGYISSVLEGNAAGIVGN